MQEDYIDFYSEMGVASQNAINGFYTRLKWDSFWANFYADVYSELATKFNRPLLAHEMRKADQLNKMVDYMAYEIRRRKEKRKFYRSMVWFYTFSEKSDMTIDQYNYFTGQVEKGYVRFPRFVSGSLDPSISYDYIDRTIKVKQYVERKNYGRILYGSFAAALIEFNGSCTLLDRLGRTLFSDKEVIIDPGDLWKVESAVCHRNTSLSGENCNLWEIKLFS